MIVKLCLGVRGKLAERATASVARPQGGLGASEASPPDVLTARVPSRRFAPLVSAPRSTGERSEPKKNRPRSGRFSVAIRQALFTKPAHVV